MKKIVLLWIALCYSTWGLIAQEKAEQQAIQVLQEQLNVVEEEEKKALKKQLEDINSLLNNGVIGQAEANALKLKAAEARTKRIEERQAALRESIFFLREKFNVPKDSKSIEILLDVDSYSSQKKGLRLELPPKSTSKPDEAPPTMAVQELPVVPSNTEIRSPTTLDVVFAMGLNNTVSEGVTWQGIEDESDYLFYSSRFWELGLALKTPLWKKNGLRLKYGISYQFNELEPSGNRFFGVVNGQTQLQDFSSFLYDSRFVVHNLVVPIHLEFGPTKLKSNAKGDYYSTSNKFKIGVGGYIGYNLDAEQRMEYPHTFRRRRFYRVEVLDDYDINQQIYGLSAYVGVGAFSIYGKYDLNTIFNNGARDEQFVSAGIRIDL